MTQEDLVSGIEFEELRYDKVLKKYQCSVSVIEKATGLSFSKIKRWDTYVAEDGSEERLLEDGSLEKLIVSHQKEVVL